MSIPATDGWVSSFDMINPLFSSPSALIFNLNLRLTRPFVVVSAINCSLFSIVTIAALARY
jgi:hypothetical protein